MLSDLKAKVADLLSKSKVPALALVAGYLGGKYGLGELALKLVMSWVS